MGRGDIADNWTYNNNWSPDGSPTPGSNVALTFTGTTRLTPYNDYAGFQPWQSIIFDANAGSFTISSATGANWDLYFKIENLSTNSQPINIDAILLKSSNNGNEFDPTNGNLTINVKEHLHQSTLTVFGTRTLTINNTGGSGIQQGGKLSLGSNSAGFTGTVQLNGANSYTGGTTMFGGTLAVGNNSTLGTGNLTVSGGVDTITAVNGARTITNNIVFSGSSLTFAGSNNSTINGSLTGGIRLTERSTTRLPAPC